MPMPLIILAYVGLPLLLACIFWRRGQRVASVTWFFACTAIPVIITPFAVWYLYYGFDMRGGPGHGDGLAVAAMVAAGLVWLLLTFGAFLFAPILGDSDFSDQRA